jgi:hypothetical protein
MAHHYSTVFSNQHGVAARVCPRGVVSLSIGHTSLTLRTTDFLRLAQVVRDAKRQAVSTQEIGLGERRH